jgi:hypothetical protein
MSLNEMSGSGFASKYTVNKTVSPVYTQAVAQVATASKGTLISTAPIKKSALSVAVPKAVSSPENFFNALLTIGGGNIVTGSRENTVEGITAFQAADVTTTTEAYDIAKGWVTMEEPVTQPVSDYLKDAIDTAKEKDQAQKDYWEGNVTKDAVKDVVENITKIDWGLPDFGKIADTLKWVLIGGGVLVGVYLVAKIVGGRK